MLRVVGLPAGGHDHEGVLSVEEIRSILTLSARAGEIGDREYEITKNVFHLTELEVRHIMVPRVDVDYLSLDRPMDETLRALRNSSHSRFPICERELETLIGFVHGKDVLEKLIDNQPVNLRELAREALYVPDTMALSDLLREMQANRHHVAAVVDEHGTTTGVAFREDALEEIVGPLGDEFDDETPEFHQLSELEWEVEGSLAFPDLCSRLNLHADDDGEDTIGGWMVATLGRLPKEGDTAILDRYKLTVSKLDRRRIAMLRVEIAPAATISETGC
jgi:CBS domain containing-hemolysin-like protein